MCMWPFPSLLSLSSLSACLGIVILTSLAVVRFRMPISLAGRRASHRPLFAVIFTMKSPLAVFVRVTWRGTSEFRGRNS